MKSTHSLILAAIAGLVLTGPVAAQTSATSQSTTSARNDQARSDLVAARLPDAFADGPARRVSSVRTTVQDAPAPAAQASDPAKVAVAEAMLKKTISALQSGEPNYGDMSEMLAERVRESAPQFMPLIQQFGTLQSVTHIGHESGTELFAVVFDQQATDWIIALDDEGKMRALLFRPAAEG